MRIYGHDFEARLHRNGLLASVVTPGSLFGEVELERYGLVRDEEIWVCTSRTAASSMYGRQRDLEGELLQTKRRLAQLRSNPVIRVLAAATRPIRRAIRALRR